MKYVTIVIVTVMLFSCQHEQSNHVVQDEVKESTTLSKIDDSVELSSGTQKEYIAALDTSKFPPNDIVNVLNEYDFTNLTEIEIKIEPNEYHRAVKYLGTVKSPYPDNFELIVLGFDYEGDCGVLSH